MGEIKAEVGEYLEYCEKVRGMSETTLYTKRSVILRFVAASGVREVGEIDEGAFRRWVEALNRGKASARSRNAYNTVVLAMVRYFKETGVAVPLNLTLVRKLREGKVRRKFYAREEVEWAAEGADAATGAMILLMFETGMRIAEVTRLKWSEINGRAVNFIGKGGKPREVYLSEETRARLEKCWRENGAGEYVWGAPGNGEPPTTATVRNRLKRAFREAGLEGFYPHALRHSFATDLQKKGASVAEIKEMLGHESIATTERYLHGLDGHLRELFEKYQGQ